MVEVPFKSNQFDREEHVHRLTMTEPNKQGDFPKPDFAEVQDFMNIPTTEASFVFNNLKEWTQRDDFRTLNNVHSNKSYFYRDDKSTYQGQYRSGLRDGLGLEISKKGEIYSGNFVDDFKHGSGRLILQNGSYYEGMFEKGVFEGHGTLTDKNNGFKYTGHWYRNMRHGFGTETKDDYLYRGEFVKGVKEGQGKWKMPDNAHYSGGFKNDKISGSGIYTFGDNSKFKCYRGEWVDNQMHGQGSLEYKDGKVYTGDFVNGKFEGTGNLEVPEKGRYSGSFKAGKMDGVIQFFPVKGNVKRLRFSEGVENKGK